jgi:predicted GIY-YIG superfamily endonuclease
MTIFHVYILKCKDGSYYTGHTSDLERRFSEHQQGIDKCYTSTRRPVELVYHEPCNTKNLAFHWERKIKGWTRKKKEALINQDWKLLSQLSKCKNNTEYPSTGSG